MNRACAIEAIANKRRAAFVEDLREWERRDARNRARNYEEQARREIERNGPVRPPWGGSWIPPGMLPRWGDELGDIRLRCWARLQGRKMARIETSRNVRGW